MAGIQQSGRFTLARTRSDVARFPMAAKFLVMAALVLVTLSPIVPQRAGAAVDECAKWAAPRTDPSLGDGSVASPAGSLRRLAQLLAPGQTGCVKAGVTLVNNQGWGIIVNGGTAGAPITIKSDPAGRANIRGLIHVNADNVTLTDLNFIGTTVEDSVNPKAVHILVTAAGTRITNNDIADPRDICINVGTSGDPAADTVIDGNRIHNCGTDPTITWNTGPGESGVHGVYVSYGTNTQVTNNLIYDNQWRGLQTWPTPAGTLIANNVFDGNASNVNIGSDHSGGLIVGNKKSTNTIVRDNIVTNATQWEPYPFDAGGREFKNPSQIFGNFPNNGVDYGNKVYGNCMFFHVQPQAQFAPAQQFDGYGYKGGPIPPFTGNVVSDNPVANPGYANRAAKDFHLGSGSPCLGKGPISGPQSIQPATSGGNYTPLTPARILDTRNGTGGFTGKVGQTKIDLTVVGVGGVPATGVGAVVLNLAETQNTAASASWVTAWPTGQPNPGTANVNFDPGRTTSNLVIAAVGTGGKVSLVVGVATAHLIADVQGWFPTTGYNPLTPARILDTRNNTGGFPGKVGQSKIDVTVVGVGGVPATGVGAVVLNLAETQNTTPSDSWVTAWPAGQPNPGTANVNYEPGRTASNLVVAKVGANGKVSLVVGTATAHLIADVQGWFPTTGYNPLTPARILDTRGNTGGHPGKVGQTKIDVTVVGVGGVPATGVGAVVVNLAEAANTAGGSSWVTAWPSGPPNPNTANVNFAAGQVTSNLVIVQVGTNGKISLAVGVGSAHLIADVQGWFPTTAQVPIGTTTAVTSSKNPSLPGEAVTLTAAVTKASGAGTPSGSVQFKDGGANLGGAVSLVGGSASTPPLTTLSQGAHSITAVYGGDATFSGSTSPAFTQTVSPPSAMTFQNLVTDNYKACYDDGNAQKQTWLASSSVTIGGVVFTQMDPHDTGGSSDPNVPLHGAGGTVEATLFATTASSNVQFAVFRTQAAGPFGVLMRMVNRDLLQATPIDVTLTVVRSDGATIGSALARYSYDATPIADPRGAALELNGPHGIWHVDGVRAPYNWEVDPTAQC